MSSESTPKTDGTQSLNDDTLVEGFTQAVQRAIADAHRSGQWTVHVEGDEIIRVFPDGRRERIGRIAKH